MVVSDTIPEAPYDPDAVVVAVVVSCTAPPTSAAAVVVAVMVSETSPETPSFANVAIAPDTWSAVLVWVWVDSLVEPPAVDDSHPTAMSPRPEFAQPFSWVKELENDCDPDPLDPESIPKNAIAAQVRAGSHSLALTRYEYLLLRHLMQQPNRVFSREQLLDAVWGQDSDSTDRTVDTHIKTLRAKLRAVSAELDPIQTHRGLGYSYSPDHA